MPDDSGGMGALCEVKTFGSHVDWNLSQFSADFEYMTSFVNAIENGTDLPQSSPGIIVNRIPSQVFASGVDMETEFDLYE